MSGTAASWSLKHCPRCHYPLDGLTDQPCPECGMTQIEFNELAATSLAQRGTTGFTARGNAWIWAIATAFWFLLTFITGQGEFVLFAFFTGFVAIVFAGAASQEPESPTLMRHVEPPKLTRLLFQTALLAFFVVGTFFATLGFMFMLMGVFNF